MIGLDAAGKTSLLYKLKLGEEVDTMPTIGFNVETISYGKVTFSMWDVGGQGRIRRLWRHYFQGCDAVLWVIDAADPERLEESKKELEIVMNNPLLEKATLLVYANKQDLPNAMSANDIVKGLGLGKYKHRDWFVQPCIAPSGSGVFDGLDWLGDHLPPSST
eukprot:CAMPEP_0117432798 /NCGR_PEP_ID=MMETSP0758-20121206/12232_1 /TAXON_ID=63605 /ORGANISM="Percolomonas cosmopolitus, Strain AE-1 (ATCC 50343)" /LENGTH=161 /DNA_ID=CAMNT_0005222967 /DNA_START=72 /DNA_END=557 /DNA_ORIENTATION=+